MRWFLRFLLFGGAHNCRVSVTLSYATYIDNVDSNSDKMQLSIIILSIEVGR